MAARSRSRPLLFVVVVFCFSAMILPCLRARGTSRLSAGTPASILARAAGRVFLLLPSAVGAGHEFGMQPRHGDLRFLDVGLGERDVLIEAKLFRGGLDELEGLVVIRARLPRRGRLVAAGAGL